MQKIIIHTDGGARGNPGPAGIGVVIAEEHGKIVKELSEYLGPQTNNVAEYEALIRALKACKQLFGPQTRDMEFHLKMDSELVVRQLEGRYKVKEPTLKEKFAEVGRLRLEDFPNMTFSHVYREANARADELVNEAIDKALSK